MAARRNKGRKSGFYRKALEGGAESKGGEVDAGEIKQRLLAEMRRQPGELHLLLQGSKTLLRAEAMERRMSRSRREEIAANMREMVDSLGEQLLPGPEGAE